MDRRQFCMTLSGLVGLAGAEHAWALGEKPKILWHQDLVKGHRTAVEQRKAMLVMFSASWCTYCHKMLKDSFMDPKVIAAVNQQFVPVLLDFDKDKRAAEVLEIESLPTLVVLSTQVDLLLKKPGYQKPDALLKTLQAAIDRGVEIQQTRGEATAP